MWECTRLKATAYTISLVNCCTGSGQWRNYLKCVVWMCTYESLRAISTFSTLLKKSPWKLKSAWNFFNWFKVQIRLNWKENVTSMYQNYSTESVHENKYVRHDFFGHKHRYKKWKNRLTFKFSLHSYKIFYQLKAAIWRML